MSLLDEIEEQSRGEIYDPARDVTIGDLQKRLGCGRERAEGILLKLAHEGKLVEVTVLYHGKACRAWRKQNG